MRPIARARSSRFTSSCRIPNIRPEDRTGRSAAPSGPFGKSSSSGRRPTKTSTAISIVRVDGGDVERRASGSPVEPPPVEPSAHRACPCRGRPPRTHPVRATPHQAHVRRLSRPRRRAPRAPAGRADGAAAPARTALPDTPAVAPLVVPQDARVADVPADDTMVAVPEARAIPRRPIPAAALPPDPETIGARRSAWLAVFFAAACALVTVAEYRGVAMLPADAEAPPVPPQVSVADVPAPVAERVRAVCGAEAGHARAHGGRVAGPADPGAGAEAGSRARAGATRPRVTVAVRDRGVVAAKVEPPATPAGRPEPPPALAPPGGAAGRSAAPTGADASARRPPLPPGPNRSPRPLHRRRSHHRLPSRPSSPIPRATRPTSSRR